MRVALGCRHIRTAFHLPLGDRFENFQANSRSPDDPGACAALVPPLVPRNSRVRRQRLAFGALTTSTARCESRTALDALISFTLATDPLPERRATAADAVVSNTNAMEPTSTADRVQRWVDDLSFTLRPLIGPKKFAALYPPRPSCPAGGTWRRWSQPDSAASRPLSHRRKPTGRRDVT